MMTTKNKNQIRYLIITIITWLILISPTNTQAAPDVDTVKHWLNGKKVVTGKTLWFFDSTEKIKPERITSIKIINYKEPFNMNPLAKNRGTLLAEFTYASKKGEIQCTASIGYDWELAWGGKKRYVESVIIHTKGV